MNSVTANLAKILLIALTASSFRPQIHEIRKRSSGEGISLTYILLNLVLATEQLAIYTHIIIFDYKGGEESIIANPPGFGDWLNWTQFVVTWLGQLTLFVEVFRFPPPRPLERTWGLMFYIFFLCISLLPIILELVTEPPWREHRAYDGWFGGLFIGGHILFVSPVVTFLGLLSLFVQLWETLSRDTLGALSTEGLAWQAVVFAVVGVSWVFRMGAPSRPGFFSGFMNWLSMVGWAALDNLVFAFVQGLLFFVAKGRIGSNSIAGEVAPLLE
ncbi:uncharacterized protein LTR77_007215 [Saxophila tyrrhenica]|uniref:Uncharacterized protein n=1 Tax=Saxophila tyrrhenica TaxID=1690608 RepID=A0AAV9P434_9PEZI|nr:hypothetical protein LTR77_007215 [Saxophila tyrrhenica]